MTLHFVELVIPNAVGSEAILFFVHFKILEE